MYQECFVMKSSLFEVLVEASCQFLAACQIVQANMGIVWPYIKVECAPPMTVGLLQGSFGTALENTVSGGTNKFMNAIQTQINNMDAAEARRKEEAKAAIIAAQEKEKAAIAAQEKAKAEQQKKKLAAQETKKKQESAQEKKKEKEVKAPEPAKKDNKRVSPKSQKKPAKVEKKDPKKVNPKHPHK